MRIVAKKSMWFLAIVVAAFVAGYVIRGLRESKKESPAVSEGASQQQQWWTCAMHPQIRQPKPGKCPICFMDLIPVATTEGAGRRKADSIFGRCAETDGG